MNNIGWFIIVFICWFIKHEGIMNIFLNKIGPKEESIMEYANRNILK